MKRVLSVAGLLLLVALVLALAVSAQEIRQVGSEGYVLIPASSIEHPGDAGVRMHTNFQIFIPNGMHFDGSQPPINANTPASLACVYQLVQQVSGCPINGTTLVPTGGFGAVAIVDAFDNPNAEQDLQVYSTQFGLPACTKANGCFSQVYARGSQPQNDPGGWSEEIALDIEMAHAFAPNAKIILVEAKDNSDTELYFAEDVATKLVQQAGGGTITNSWSGGEYPQELNDDSHFKGQGIVYFASTGDSGSAVGYPAASAFVVAAGGTRINRSKGNFLSEVGWSGSSGGKSVYEPIPAWQAPLKNMLGNKRGTPDFSAIADPSTGPAVYDADGNLGWFQIGGTSVSSPLLAGVVNGDGYKAKSTTQELTGVYQYARGHYSKVWRDETSGSNRIGSCLPGWDFVTGIGSPLTPIGK